MHIACDIDGGDNAPTMIIDGIIKAAITWPTSNFTLLGNSQVSHQLPSNVKYRHVTQTILSIDNPLRAVRSKPDSSIVIGCQMLGAAECDAFISAGNTGALMAAGLLYTGKIRGADRPALAPIFPTLHTDKQVLVLDVGANVDAKAEHLRQYALLGSKYVESMLKIENPKVGLLNIGTESNKGTKLLREVYGLLQDEEKINFIGNVEARDFLTGECDVLLCDGFSGNILLKTTEGVAAALFQLIKEACTSTFISKLALAVLRPKLRSVKDKMDYRKYGGVPLLGIAGALIKAHGSSDASAFFHAIKQAQSLVKSGVVNEMIGAEL